MYLYANGFVWRVQYSRWYTLWYTPNSKWVSFSGAQAVLQEWFFYSQHDDDDDNHDDHDDHDDHDGDNAAADCDDDQQWNCFFTNQLEYNPLPWTKLSWSRDEKHV